MSKYAQGHHTFQIFNKEGEPIDFGWIVRWKDDPATDDTGKYDVRWAVSNNFTLETETSLDELLEKYKEPSKSYAIWLLKNKFKKFFGVKF